MANILTGLIPTLYRAANQVAREQTGFIEAVGQNFSNERAAVGQTIRIPIAGESTVANNTPAMEVPNTGDTTDGYTDMTITNSKHYPVKFTGEEELSLGNNYNDLITQKYALAFRALRNLVESDIANTYKKVSRAHGTAGTTPFSVKDDFDDLAGVFEILEDNGSPTNDLQLVGGSAMWRKLRGTQTGILQKVNESGTPAALRNGEFERIHGFALRNSAEVKTHTKGTGTSYLVNDADGLVSGDTSITVDTGSGTVLAGDVITFAGDTSNYIVGTDLANNAFTINKPGIFKSTIANNAAITVGNDYTANMAFDRQAIQLIARRPAISSIGDKAEGNRVQVTDISGLVFDVALYPGYLQGVVHISLAWGVDIIKPEFTALLLG